MTGSFGRLPGKSKFSAHHRRNESGQPIVGILSEKGECFLILRTLLFYSALIIAIRLMGKRQVGQMEPSEFVVTMLLANLAAIPLENSEEPVLNGLIPMALVLLAERVVSWICLKSIPLRRLFCGKPVILIDNGTLIYENLKRTRINLDELTGHLRELGILEVEKVQFAILETNGSITAFPFPQHRPADAADAGIPVKKQELPYTVISDGQVLEQNLTLAGKDRTWLDHHLTAQRVTVSDVVLLTVTKGGRTCLIRR